MSTCFVGGFTLTKCGRFWAVRDKAGCLVCLTVYKKGGREVIRWLDTAENNAEQEEHSSCSRFYPAPFT